MKRSLCARLLTLALASSVPASAQLDFRAAVTALRENANRSRLPRALSNAPDGRVSLIVDRARAPDAPLAGLVPVGSRYGAIHFAEDELGMLAGQHRNWHFDWAPARRLLLDQAAGSLSAPTYRAHTARTGRGVVVGIVDSGADLSHPDLRHADGTTRVLRLIDFSRRPLGLRPELEAKYGCAENDDCAVLAAEDIDLLLGNRVLGDEPSDVFGHGTHVASLAAGNGRANPAFTGVAPEASLIIARATRSGGPSILDPDILRATAFIFEEAKSLGMPAVVNLSLGSDFGAHDGSSLLERALADFVGPEQPGRAIVVAAGNSAGVFVGLTDAFPSPLGVHTEVHVVRSTSVRVPLLTPPTGEAKTRATVFVWVKFDAGDRVAVGLDSADGRFIEPLAPGRGATFQEDELEVTVLNGISDSSNVLELAASSAVVVLDGAWQAGRTFALRFEGHGTAKLWVQSDGALGAGSIGALFPAASKEGTINVPASHPLLIAVGATTNRTEWVDHAGNLVSMPQNGALDVSPQETPAFFSSAGPNALGFMKPDIVAPGMHVIGAMSGAADPRENGGQGLFASRGRCEPFDEECFVISDAHAAATGTSMAAPLVTGAVALLFERDPLLTQEAIRNLLRASARRPNGVVLVEQQLGPGTLDLRLLSEIEEATASSEGRRPSAAQSWISLGSSFARPDAMTPFAGFVHLRDELGHIADGFDGELHLTAEPAQTLVALERLAPGLHRFELVAPKGSGQRELYLRVLLDEELLLERRVPIAVDAPVSRRAMSPRGSCSVVTSKRSRAALGPLLLMGALGAARRKRRAIRAASS